MKRRLNWRLAAAVAAVGAVALAAACSDSGVKQEEYDKVKNDLESANSEVQAKNTQLQQKEAEAAQLQQQIDDLEAQVAGLMENVPLIFARKVPTPTPAPTATPLPAGVTPTQAPPRATAPPSYYDDTVGAYYVYVEHLVTSRASSYDIAANISCVQSSVFIRGQRIVWRIEVVDMATGKRVTDKSGETLKIKLPNGDEVTGRWSQRGGGRVPDAPFMWSFNWDIPPDFPLGGIDYVLEVSKEGQSAFSWKPIAIVSETSDTRPQVIQ